MSEKSRFATRERICELSRPALSSARERFGPAMQGRPIVLSLLLHENSMVFYFTYTPSKRPRTNACTSER